RPIAAKSRSSKAISRTDPLSTKRANSTKTAPTKTSKTKNRDLAKENEAVAKPENFTAPGSKKQDSDMPQSSTKSGNAETSYLILVSITLTSDPTIPRLLTLPPSLTFAKFHQALQIALGWTNSHMHQFIVGFPTPMINGCSKRSKRPKTVIKLQSSIEPYENIMKEADLEDDTKWTLRDVIEKKEWKGQSIDSVADIHLMYEYDMGDGWAHQINALGRTDRGLHGSLTGLQLDDAQKKGGDKELKEWYKHRCVNGDKKGLDPWNWDLFDINEKLEYYGRSRIPAPKLCVIAQPPYTMPPKPLPTDLPIHSFPSALSLETFLSHQHLTLLGFHLKLAKKSSRIPSVSAAEAVETALCFGWIDGRANALDDNYWLVRYTPRRAKSIWSKKNVNTVSRLMEEGRMRAAGMQAVEAAKKDGRWERAYAGPASMQVPGDFAAVLEGEEGAKEFFEGLNRTERFSVLWRVETASVKGRGRKIEGIVGCWRRGSYRVRRRKLRVRWLSRRPRRVESLGKELSHPKISRVSIRDAVVRGYHLDGLDYDLDHEFWIAVLPFTTGFAAILAHRGGWSSLLETHDEADVGISAIQSQAPKRHSIDGLIELTNAECVREWMIRQGEPERQIKTWWKADTRGEERTRAVNEGFVLLPEKELSLPDRMVKVDVYNLIHGLLFIPLFIAWSSMTSLLLTAFQPLRGFLFAPHLLAHRWLLLALQPTALLISTLKALPYIFSRPSVVYRIPTCRPNESLRALIYNHPSTCSKPSAPSSKRPLHIDIHGGTSIGGIPEYDVPFCDRLARITGAVVVSVTYRFAPRHTFSAAHDDVDGMFAWLLEKAEERFGVDPALLTVSGFSAKGNLALAGNLNEDGRVEKPVFKGQYHGWLELPSAVIDESSRERAFEAACNFIREVHGNVRNDRYLWKPTTDKGYAGMIISLNLPIGKTDHTSVTLSFGSCGYSSTDTMTIIWGLDLREMQWRKFKGSYMFSREYPLRPAKMIVYQLAMISCVCSESVGTAVLSDYVDQQDFIEKHSQTATVYNDDFIGAASYNIFVGVVISTIFGAAFFFDLFWPERYETPAIKLAWRICAVVVTVMALGDALTMTLIVALKTARITGVDTATAASLLKQYSKPPLAYRHSAEAVSSVVLLWLGFPATVASTFLLFASQRHNDRYGARLPPKYEASTDLPEA
ncbi:MAG: hypothetical protein Q9170_008013, partial [Blastenia crenularia]